MHKKTRRSRIHLTLILSALLLLTCRCNPDEPPQPTTTPLATYTVFPTHTPYPTYTPAVVPTFTPYPTYTPYPTHTIPPSPTATSTTAPTDPPTPTNTPYPTATPETGAPAAEEPVPPSSDQRSTLYETMVDTRTQIEHFGGMIDTALGTGMVSCQEVVDRFDRLAASPTYDVSSSAGEIQSAYAQYRQAVSIFIEGAKDMTHNCREFLSDPKSGTIPFQQWGLARQRINEALGILNGAIPLVE